MQKENSPFAEDSRKTLKVRVDVYGLDEALQKIQKMRDLLQEIRDLHNEIFNCNPEMCDVDQVIEKISQAVLDVSKKE